MSMKQNNSQEERQEAGNLLQARKERLLLPLVLVLLAAAILSAKSVYTAIQGMEALIREKSAWARYWKRISTWRFL